MLVVKASKRHFVARAAPWPNTIATAIVARVSKLEIAKKTIDSGRESPVEGPVVVGLGSDSIDVDGSAGEVVAV